MGKFEGFDWGTFWDDSEYALESHVGKEPTDEEMKEIEDELGYKLPESYIKSNFEENFITKINIENDRFNQPTEKGMG